MDKIEEYLLHEFTKVLEKKNELELQLTIVKQDYEKVLAAYKAYKEKN
jgi:hypothetical protein